MPETVDIKVTKVEMQSQTETGRRAIRTLMHRYERMGMTARMAEALVNEGAIKTANL